MWVAQAQRSLCMVFQGGDAVNISRYPVKYFTAKTQSSLYIDGGTEPRVKRVFALSFLQWLASVSLPQTFNKGGSACAQTQKMRDT